MHNTEDKPWWCEAGLRREQGFLDDVMPQLKLSARMNPAKEHDPYAIDFVLDDGQLVDLKCQTTPFFTAQRAFGIDSRFCVTFNRKDYENYLKKRPIYVLWWVHWEVLEKTFSGDWGSRTIVVEPLSGVWLVRFTDMAKAIEEQESRAHRYERRVGDKKGNALDSYGFDVRLWERLTADGWQGPCPSSYDPPDEWRPAR